MSAPAETRADSETIRQTRNPRRIHSRLHRLPWRNQHRAELRQSRRLSWTNLRRVSQSITAPPHRHVRRTAARHPVPRRSARRCRARPRRCPRRAARQEAVVGLGGRRMCRPASGRSPLRGLLDVLHRFREELAVGIDLPATTWPRPCEQQVSARVGECLARHVDVIGFSCCHRLALRRSAAA